MSMTVWLTKYALTRGIQKAEGCTMHDLVGDAGEYATRGRYGQPSYIFAKIGKDAFKTEAAATANAVDRAQRRIRAIEGEKRRLLADIARWVPKK